MIGITAAAAEIREGRSGETAPACRQVLPVSLFGKPKRIPCVKGKEGNFIFPNLGGNTKAFVPFAAMDFFY